MADEIKQEQDSDNTCPADAVQHNRVGTFCKCGREIVSKSLRKGASKNEVAIRVRIVFMDENMNLLGVCPSCKSSIIIPTIIKND
jgi:hypothetical protein